MKATEPQRQKKILDDLRGSLPPFYITLTSIIQSVLVGFLLFVVNDTITNKDSPDPVNWLLVVTSFLMIILVWDEYRIGASMFRWIPTLRDSIIPFAVGAAQFLTIRNIGDHEMWFRSIAVCWGLGVIAYVNMYYSAANESPENDAMLSVIDKYRWGNPLLCFVYAMIFVFLSWFSTHNNLGLYSLNTALDILSLLLMIMFLWRGEIYWRKVIRLAREE